MNRDELFEKCCANKRIGELEAKLSRIRDIVTKENEFLKEHQDFPFPTTMDEILSIMEEK